MIVADAGALIVLIDGDAWHHQVLRQAFETRPDDWLFPWAILPEVDHIVATRLGRKTARALHADLASGRYVVEWGVPSDFVRALELQERYADLELGLVDTVVMATAERIGARAIATLDLRDFGAVELDGAPELWPRDLPPA